MKNAPIMVPVNAFGYSHFVVFRGIHGNRVLLADPAWGNRTMTIEKFQHMWLDYGKPIGRVGFVVHRTKPDRRRANARPSTSKCAASTSTSCARAEQIEAPVRRLRHARLRYCVSAKEELHEEKPRHR